MLCVTDILLFILVHEIELYFIRVQDDVGKRVSMALSQHAKFVDYKVFLSSYSLKDHHSSNHGNVCNSLKTCYFNQTTDKVVFTNILNRCTTTPVYVRKHNVRISARAAELC